MAKADLRRPMMAKARKQIAEYQYEMAETVSPSGLEKKEDL